MFKHPCVKDCPERSTYCKLSCQKFRKYESIKKIERKLNEPKIRAERDMNGYKAEQSNKAFKKWCAR